MFVKCSKKVRFTHPENNKVVWEMPAGFIGDIPSWVEKDWYFDACCKDGTITAIKSKSDRDIQAALDDKEAEERRKLEEVQKAAAGNSPDGSTPGSEPEETDPNKQSDGKKSNGGKK